MKLSLRTAAREVGVSKTTILRAVRSGRVSATRKDDGEYEIEPAELFRVYTPHRNGEAVVAQDAPPDRTEDRVCIARLEERVKALEAALEVERRRADEDRRRAETQADELRRERDRWAGVAETTQRQLTDLTAKRKGFAWWFRRGV